PGELAAADGAGSEVRLPAGMMRAAPVLGLRTGAKVLVSVRPEHWRIEPVAAPGRLAGTVKAVMPLGPQVVYDVEIAGGTSIKINQAREQGPPLLEGGAQIHFAPASPAACLVFPFEPT